MCSAPSCDGRCLHKATDPLPRVLYSAPILPPATRDRAHSTDHGARNTARTTSVSRCVAPPQAIAGVGVIAVTRSRRRIMSSPVAAVAGSSCRLRLLTRQRSWRRRGSAGGGVSAVDTLHERAQHAAPAGTAAGRSVEGRPRMHECYTRECGVNAASRPAPRGARARCPRRAVSVRLQGVCERTVLNLPHGGLLSCCERRHSLLSNVTTTWKHAHGISGLSSGATTGRTCS